MVEFSRNSFFQCCSPMFQISKGPSGNHQIKYQCCLTATGMLESPVHQTGNSIQGKEFAQFFGSHFGVARRLPDEPGKYVVNRSTLSLRLC